MEMYIPQHWFLAEELQNGDGEMQDITPADKKLIEVYGDSIHQNDGRHLDGGVGGAEDRKWQRLYLWVTLCKLALYNLPIGRWANCFLALQTDELFCQVRKRKCNSEKALIFAACILRKVKDIKCFSNVKLLIWARLNGREMGKYCALVKAVGVRWEAI